MRFLSLTTVVACLNTLGPRKSAAKELPLDATSEMHLNGLLCVVLLFLDTEVLVIRLFALLGNLVRARHLQGSQGRQETCQVGISVVLPPFLGTEPGKLWMSLCNNLVSESVFVRNWHNELSVREASGGEALLQVVLVDPLPTSVEVGLVLSTASLLDSTSAIFPVSHFFKRTTHNEEPLNGVAACLIV